MYQKIAVIIVIATGLFACYFFITSDIDSNDLQRILRKWRGVAPVLFIAMHTVRPLTFLPTSILILLAALYFDFWPGLLLNFLGISLSMTVAYAAGRILGHEWLVSRYPVSENVISKLNSVSWSELALLRLIPMFPADLISYSSGVIYLPFPRYIIGSILGSIPGLILIMSLGRGIRAGEMFWLILVLPIGIVMTYLLWKKAGIVWN